MSPEHESSTKATHPEQPMLGIEDLEEKKAGESILQKVTGEIDGIKDNIARVLDMSPGPEVVAIADEAIIDKAEEADKVGQLESQDAFRLAVVETGLEELGQEVSSNPGRTPVAELERNGFGNEIDKVIAELSRSEDPNEVDVATAVAQAIDELSSHPIMEDATGIEYVSDPNKAHEIAISEDKSRENEKTLVHDLAELKARFPEGSRPVGAQAAIDRLTNRMEVDIPAERKIMVQNAAEQYDYRFGREETARKEQAELNVRVDARIDSDQTPWSVDEKLIPKEKTDGIKVWTLWMKEREARRPELTDEYTIPLAIDKDSVDYRLLHEAGINDERIARRKLTRAELQSAGIFFVNRLGGGEKSIIAGTVPDNEHPGQDIDFSQRAFLTRKELELVYGYQQKNGQGLEGESVDQVRTDMFVFLHSIKMEGGMTAAGENVKMRGNHKGGALLERSSKLAGTLSPFIDQGFVFDGNNPDILISFPDGTPKRFNMVNVYLPGAHPDFPGLSEMGKSDWDQDYLTTGDYVRRFYPKMPTREEAEFAEKNNLPTDRELVWSNDLNPTEISE